MSEIHVKGLSDLQKLLNTLPAKIEQNALRGALRAAANVVKKEAQALVPKQSGALRDSIRVSVRARYGKVTASIKAGGGPTKKQVRTTPSGRTSVKYSNAYYAHMVEYGTRAHYLKSQKTKAWRLVANKQASSGFAKRLVVTGETGAMHPGARPHPYMRPALDNRAGDALVAAGEYLKKRLATKEGLDTAGIDIEVEA